MKKSFFFFLFIFQFASWGQNYAFENEVSHKNGLVLKDGKAFTGILYSDDEGIPNACECTLEAHYKNGVLHGLKQTWFQNGKLKFKGKFNEGKPVGTHLYYYPNGNLKKEEVYKNGKIIASTLYNRDGSIKGKKKPLSRQIVQPSKPVATAATSQALVQNSVQPNPQKSQTQISSVRDTLKIVSQNGAEEGLKKIYDESGQLKRIALYRGGLLVKDTLFFAPGVPQTIKKYDEGELVHLEKYNQNGKLITEQNFLNNKKHGINRIFFENGELQKMEVYEYGLPVHIEIYNESGHQTVEENYKFGKKHGIQKYFDENGKLLEIAKYEAGTLLEKEKLLPDGKEIIKTKDNLKEISTLDINGKLRAKYFVNAITGKQDSLQRTFDVNTGKIKSEMLYSNGKIRRKGQYKNGNKHGVWQFYYPDGKGEKKVVYNNGKLVEQQEIWYDRQIKNAYKPGDLVFVKQQYYPKIHSQYFLLRIPPPDGKETEFIQQKIIQTFRRNGMKKIAVSDDVKEKQLEYVIKIDTIQTKLKNKNNKYIYLIQLNLSLNDFKNPSEKYRWTILPQKKGKKYSQMFVRNKKEAFFNTLRFAGLKTADFLQQRFPLLVTVRKKSVSGDKVRSVYVNYGRQQGAKPKLIFKYAGAPAVPEIRIKLTLVGEKVSQAEVISGGKLLLEKLKQDKIQPFKLMAP